MRTTVIDLADRADLAAEAAALDCTSTRSCVLAPLVVTGRLLGCVALELIRRDGTWQPSVVSLVDQYAPTLAAAIERRRIEREFREAQLRFEQAWRHAPIGMAMLAVDGRVWRVNPALCEMLGRRDHTLPSGRLHDLVHADDVAALDAELRRLCERATDRAQVELRLDERWCRVSLSIVHDDDVQGPYAIAQVEDVTERRQFEARLAYEATHDALTGLPQRKPLLGSLERALAGAARRGDKVAVLFIDLDHFKHVNDTLGHAAGDELLQAFANRLLRAVRASDMAARLGGDEFVVMCPDLHDPRQVVSVSQRVLALVERPFRVHGVEVFVGASIGIAVAEAGVDAATLLRQADTAAYRAKERGRNRYEIFDDDLRAAVARRVENESVLRNALDHDALTVVYQPIIDVASGGVVAFEALVRSDAADDLTALAEETGLAARLGGRVLREACAHLATWRRQLGARAPGLSVDVSLRQLTHPAFVSEVKSVAEASRVDPSCITFEVAEALVQDSPAVVERLDELRALGVRLAIDGFGAGYSSLARLRRLPVDVVKVDPSFVAELGSAHDGSTIFAALIDLAHALGMVVVADGVEHVEHVAALVTLGCDRLQGSYFAEPMSADDALHLASQGSADPRHSTT